MYLNDGALYPHHVYSMHCIFFRMTPLFKLFALQTIPRINPHDLTWMGWTMTSDTVQVSLTIVIKVNKRPHTFDILIKHRRLCPVTTTVATNNIQLWKKKKKKKLWQLTHRSVCLNIGEMYLQYHEFGLIADQGILLLHQLEPLLHQLGVVLLAHACREGGSTEWE